MARTEPGRKYVRFEHPDGTPYGLWEGAVVHELGGDIFNGAAPTGRDFEAAAVRFLVPCVPSKVIAVGLNYASHREFVEGNEGVFVNAAGRRGRFRSDVLFTGTPGQTQAVTKGDTVEVEIEGIGVLRNTVAG